MLGLEGQCTSPYQIHKITELLHIMVFRIAVSYRLRFLNLIFEQLLRTRGQIHRWSQDNFETVPKIRSCLIPKTNSQNSYDNHKKSYD